MEVNVRNVYDQSVDTVFQAFGNKDSVERKFKALGARNIQVEKCKLTKTSLNLVTSREVPVNAPTLLKKFLGEWNLARQEEQWKGIAGKSYQGHAKISIKGVPVTITAKMVLASSGKGCTNDVTLTIDSSIPFIGKKLAEFVGETSVTEMQKQYSHIKGSLIATAPALKMAAAKPVAAKPDAVKPVAKVAAKKSVKTAATPPATKKVVAAKTAATKPVVKAVVATPVAAKRAARTAGEKPSAKSVTTAKPVGAKPSAKAVAAKPVVKKVAMNTTVLKPVAKNAEPKLVSKPAAARKSAPKKKSH